MRYIFGSWHSATPAVLLTFLITGVVPTGSVGQRPDIRRSLGLDSAAFVVLQDQINGRRAIRVRVGSTDWRLTRPVLDGTRFTYDFIDVSSNQDSLSIVDAEEIWVRRNAMVPGAKYGAVAFGIPSVIIGVGLTLPCRGDQSDAAFCEASVGSAAALVGIGVALGAVVGGVLGMTQSHWKSVYKRSRIVPSLRVCGFSVGSRLCAGTGLVF